MLNTMDMWCRGHVGGGGGGDQLSAGHHVYVM